MTFLAKQQPRNFYNIRKRTRDNQFSYKVPSVSQIRFSQFFNDFSSMKAVLCDTIAFVSCKEQLNINDQLSGSDDEQKWGQFSTLLLFLHFPLLKWGFLLLCLWTFVNHVPLLQTRLRSTTWFNWSSWSSDNHQRWYELVFHFGRGGRCNFFCISISVYGLKGLGSRIIFII